MQPLLSVLPEMLFNIISLTSSKFYLSITDKVANWPEAKFSVPLVVEIAAEAFHGMETEVCSGSINLIQVKQ